jgi:hypothetical protein
MSKTPELTTSEVIKMVDFGLGEAWDALDEPQKKELKNKFFLLNRYISVAGNPKRGSNPTTEEQQHFVLFVNERFNKHWNTLQKDHPKLLWLLLCSCSYNKKDQFFHEWIGYKPKENNINKKIKFLAEIYPNRKMQDIEVLSELISDKELKELGRKYGMDEATLAKKIK